MSGTFDGLRGLLASTSTESQQPLTRADIDALFATLCSDEYHEVQRSRDIAMNQGYILLAKALEQGVITEGEYWYLSSTIGGNGGLIVSTAMSERLARVKEQEA